MISHVRWIEPNELQDSSPVERLWNAVGRENVNSFVANVRTQMRFVKIGNHIIPITINDREYENSYVCSPYNSVITYPLEEIRLLPNPLLRRTVSGLIHVVAPLLKIGKINRCVALNNWLLSTNLYPIVEMDSWSAVIDRLKVLYPSHALIMRSLNRATNAILIDHLRTRDFILVPSRQVYMYDGMKAEFIKRHNTKVDLRLLEHESQYRIASHDQINSDDDLRIHELYSLLYLDRYSRNNPQFTSKLIRNWRETKTMTFFGLRNRAGVLDGIVGCFEVDGTITAPVVGYDTALPKSLGLYRRLMAIVYREALDRGLTLNLSSGAASFKRLRGGLPELEYTAVYYRHLSVHQRLTWKTLQMLLTRIGAPLLKRYEL